MARRKEIVGVAHGVISSFNSRNNDVGGYWAIGQLKSFAATNGLDSITFNLLPIEPAFNIALITEVTNNYSAKLSALLISQHIPADWVLNAAITIQFSGATPSPSEIFRYALGGILSLFLWGDRRQWKTSSCRCLWVLLRTFTT